MSKPLVPLSRAREALGGVSESTLRRMLRSGMLESVKVGRRRMVTAQSLDALLESLIEDSSNA